MNVEYIYPGFMPRLDTQSHYKQLGTRSSKNKMNAEYIYPGFMPRGDTQSHYNTSIPDHPEDI